MADSITGLTLAQLSDTVTQMKSRANGPQPDWVSAWAFPLSEETLTHTSCVLKGIDPPLKEVFSKDPAAM